MRRNWCCVLPKHQYLLIHESCLIDSNSVTEALGESEAVRRAVAVLGRHLWRGNIRLLDCLKFCVTLSAIG